MKIKAKRDTYPVPPIGQWVRITFEEGSREHMTADSCFAVQLVEWQDMMEMKGRTDEPILGVPTKMAHNKVANVIVIFPAPEKNGELYLGFYPPMVEI